MEDSNVYAVLTGDIVKSSDLPQHELEAVRESLLQTVGEAKSWRRGLVKGKAEFFRGDAWQLLLSQPEFALRVALFIRAAVRAQGFADTRISLGLGAATKISTHRISLSTGPAFVLSGHHLDEMQHGTYLSLAVDPSAGAWAALLPAVGQLCDAQVRQWTQRQSEIVWHALAPTELTQEQIAERLSPPVSRQTVAKSLDGAGWTAIRGAVRAFEDIDWSQLLSR